MNEEVIPGHGCDCMCDECREVVMAGLVPTISDEEALVNALQAFDDMQAERDAERARAERAEERIERLRAALQAVRYENYGPRAIRLRAIARYALAEDDALLADDEARR